MNLCMHVFMHKRWLFKIELSYIYPIFSVSGHACVAILHSILLATRLELFVQSDKPSKRRVKTQLPFAGIIRSSPYFPR